MAFIVLWIPSLERCINWNKYLLQNELLLYAHLMLLLHTLYGGIKQQNAEDSTYYNLTSCLAHLNWK